MALTMNEQPKRPWKKPAVVSLTINVPVVLTACTGFDGICSEDGSCCSGLGSPCGLDGTCQ
jgi:hypothetical protein